MFYISQKLYSTGNNSICFGNFTILNGLLLKYLPPMASRWRLLFLAAATNAYGLMLTSHSTIPSPTTLPSLVSSSMTVSLPSQTGLPSCAYQGLPTTTLLTCTINSLYAQDYSTCKAVCLALTACLSYSYRSPTDRTVSHEKFDQLHKITLGGQPGSSVWFWGNKSYRRKRADHLISC